MLVQVAVLITEKLNGKQPIIIFEDIDKLNPEDAWKVFYNYAAILSGVSFPVIYTFPIGLSYDSRFSALEGYFITKTLPMIKIEAINGEEYTQGIQVIKKIVEKRADLELFENGVLDKLIRYTGGSLRDLFYCINTAGKRAERRDSTTISEEDAQRALEELKTSLTRRIERGDYIGIYDYKQQSNKNYSVETLRDWIQKCEKLDTFFIFNLQIAIQSEIDRKRLNFSRDILAGLNKNIIFVTTQNGDDRLAREAYDFYSFIKLHITFTDERQQEVLLSLSGAEKKEKVQFNQKISILEGNREEKLNESIKQVLAKAISDTKEAQRYKMEGKYKDAENLYKKALEIRKEVLGERHLETVSSYNNLANLYAREGRYEEAEELCKKALKIRKEVLGERHPETASSYNNLASLYVKEGKYEEAEELCKKALRIRKEVLGEKHPDTITSYSNLANLYVGEGKYEEAEELYKKVLKIREEVLGKKHIETGNSYNNLAIVYAEKGKYEEAEELYKKALEIYEKVLGGRHPDTINSYSNLATVYAEKGKYEEAEELYKKALKIRKEVLGERHPDTIATYDNLTSLYKSRQQSKKIETLECAFPFYRENKS